MNLKTVKPKRNKLDLTKFDSRLWIQ